MTSLEYGNGNTPDPRTKYCPSLSPRMWRGRHHGDSQAYAEEVALRLGGRATVIKHGDFSWAVYQPKFDEIKVELHEGTVQFTPQFVNGEWEMLMVAEDDVMSFSRGDLATLAGSMLPAAIELLDSLRGGMLARPVPHGARSRTTVRRTLGNMDG